MKFKGKSEGQDFEADIEFYKPIDAEKSKYKVMARSVQFHIMKKMPPDDADEEMKKDARHWPHLLKDKTLEKNEVRLINSVVCLYSSQKSKRTLAAHFSCHSTFLLC